MKNKEELTYLYIFLKKFDINKPNSNKKTIGSANKICESTSGGVKTAPKMNAKT